MTRRHAFEPGVWTDVARRLDETIRSHSGEDAFDAARLLLVAKLEGEAEGAGRFGPGVDAGAIEARLARARARWPGVLEPGARCHLPAPALRRCAALLDTVHLLDDDLAGLDAVFEFVVAQAAKGQKGQYFTPRHVVAAVTAMAAPAAGERVVDPACGSGAFLRHASRAAPGAEVLGVDHDPRAVQVARVMLAASGHPPERAVRADALARGPLAGHATGSFDLVLTNPPFAGDVGPEVAAGYALAQGRRVERDALFLERCVDLLRPGGRLAIVLPHNKLGGQRWGFLRRWLLGRARVAAVVALGRNTFLPHTTQKTCVLFAVKRAEALDAPPPGETITFFVSDRDGKDARGRLTRDAASGAVDHDLGEATDAVRAALAEARG
ncbi:MAG: SAM-dependent DNA methyltransferase [Myxococcales bacterium]|nr:SAM-dependent DNA methyltransferase [Myxococcales bacterium]